MAQRVERVAAEVRAIVGEALASVLDIPTGTVQSRLHYALKRLHAAIDTADGKGTIR